MKKAGKILATTTIFLTAIFSAGAANFVDTGGTPASAAVDFLAQRKIINGFSDKTFRPKNQITRAEFLKMALLAAGKKPPKNCVPMKTFSDVSPSAWYADIICEAVNENIVAGYDDGKMRPNAPISFAEAAKILVNINKIPILGAGKEWFEKYVMALDRERIFPDSIKNPNKKLTRGEMAQMVWAEMTGRELIKTERGDLPKVESCDELAVQIQKAQKRRQFGRGHFLRKNIDFLDGDDVTFGASAVEEKAAPAADFSTTNVQEFGVDEADIVKNDGSHIFLIKENTVRIIRAFPPEKLSEDAKILIDDGKFTPREMFVDGDILTIIGRSGYFSPNRKPMPTGGIVIEDRDFKPSFPKTKVISFDISDRRHPQKIREVSFDARYLSSRKIGDTVFVALNKGFFWNGPIFEAEKIIPAFSDSANSTEKTLVKCGDIRYVPNFSDNNFLILAAIDPKKATKKVDREVILGGGQKLYASRKNIFVTRQKWDEVFFDDGQNSGFKNAEKTEIFKFALGENSVQFVAKGEVLGRPLNQFSMSEFAGNFRIATQTDGIYGKKKRATNVFVLDENLKKIGEITEIAPGENMKSARFLGNRAFLVTFKTVDPLFVLDFSDPRRPKILGKLKIPGWSDYLHPWGDHYLLGFGREVDASIDADKVHSDDAVYYTALLGMKISLFDISDLENPREIHHLVIGDRGTTSELLQNHKALFVDEKRGIVGFPITITKNKTPEKVGAAAQIETVFSGAIVLNVDPKKGISERGRATNYKTDDFFKKSGEYFYGDPDRNILRILSIGDFFYTVAPNFIQALSGENLAVKKEITIDPKKCSDIFSEAECAANPACKTIYKNLSNCVKLFGKKVVCTENPVFSQCEAIK